MGKSFDGSDIWCRISYLHNMSTTCHFSYLDSGISFSRDINNKLNKFQWICETNQSTFKNKINKDTKMKFYMLAAYKELHLYTVTTVQM